MAITTIKNILQILFKLRRNQILSKNIKIVFYNTFNILDK